MKDEDEDIFGKDCIGPGGVCIQRVGEPEGTVCHYPICPEYKKHKCAGL